MMPTIKLYVNTGFCGADHEDTEEISDEEWEAMSEKQRNNYLEEIAREYLHNCVDFGAYVDDGSNS